MIELNEHMESRLHKMRELEALGVKPFGQPFKNKNHARDLHAEFGDHSNEAFAETPINCSLAGRIMMVRSFGKAVFAHMQDSTARIQVYMKRDIMGEEAFKVVNLLDLGDLVGVEGRLFRTKTNELTVEVHKLCFLAKALRPLPEKFHGLTDTETRYRQRYLDLIVNPDVKETFRRRSGIIKTIRDHLEAHNFIEVETPMMQAIPGGATARPFKTHHNALGIDLYLRIAPELYLKRLLVGGFERVFELNRNFRNEGLSKKHNPEFTMIEFYAAYKDYTYLMAFTEDLFAKVLERVIGTQQITFGDNVIDFTPPWPKLPFAKSMMDRGVPAELMTNPVFAYDWAVAKGIDVPDGASHAKVLDEVFSKLVEPFLIQPTFIVDYPVELSPLAKRKADEPHLVERFELFIAGWEVANAFSELNDPLDQHERFKEQARAREGGDDEALRMDDDFVRALEHAMPPAAGEGIGIDRLVMILTDSHTIKDVILFPQMRPELHGSCPLPQPKVETPAGEPKSQEGKGGL